MQCEICGGKQASVRVLIEGTQMNVCTGCSSYGKKLAPVAPSRPTPRPSKVSVPEEAIVEGFGRIIKNAREAKGLSHKELAHALAEKESLIAHIEGGHAEPSILLARKMERFLGVSLVEIVPQVSMKMAPAAASALTIGDAIRVRRR